MTSLQTAGQWSPTLRRQTSRPRAKVNQSKSNQKIGQIFQKKKETTNYSRRRRQIGSLPIRRRRRRRLMISDGGSLTNAEPPSSYANEPRQRRPISSDPIEFRVPPPPPPPISSVARPPGLPSFYRVFYAD